MQRISILIVLMYFIITLKVSLCVQKKDILAKNGKFGDVSQIKNGVVAIWLNTDFNRIEVSVLDATGSEKTKNVVYPKGSGNLGYPKVCEVSKSDGSFVVSWQEQSTDGGYDVWGQLFFNDGEKKFSPFLLNELSTYTNYHVDISSLSSLDGFIAVWEKIVGEQRHTYGRIFSSTGSQLTGEFGINNSDQKKQIFPSVNVISSSKFIVTYTDERGNHYGQIFDSAGKREYREFLLGEVMDPNETDNIGKHMTSACVLDDTKFVVVWQKKMEDGSYDIFGQVFSTTGQKIGDRFEINTFKQSYQTYPVVKPFQNGFFVVWQSLNRKFGVFGRIFNEIKVVDNQIVDIEKYPPEFEVSNVDQEVLNVHEHPSLEVASDDSYYIVWTKDDGNSTSIYGNFVYNEIPSSDDLTFFLIIGGISIGVVIVLCVFFTVSIIAFTLLNKKSTKKRKNTFSIGSRSAQEELDEIDKILKNEEEKKSANLTINSKLFEINFDEIKSKKSIGKGGSNAIILLAEWQGLECAFKCFKISDFNDGTENRFSEFEKEVQILSSTSHPNILRFFGASLQIPRVGILMEYCEHGDCADFLNNYRKKNSLDYPLPQRLRILKEIASGMKYLHGKEIVHRDLKPENVLISKNYNAKIMDFGISKLMVESNSQNTKRVGTSMYMAPEVCLGTHYTSKCDVFSYGIVIYTVTTQNFFPFGRNTFNIEYKIANDQNFRPRINEEEWKDLGWLKKLMIKCWEKAEELRPTFKEIGETFETNIQRKKAPSLPPKSFLKSKRNIKRSPIPKRPISSRVPKKRPPMVKKRIVKRPQSRF